MRKLALLLLLSGCSLPPPDNTDAGSGFDGGDAGLDGTGALSGPLAFGVTDVFEVHNVDTRSGQLLGFTVEYVDHGKTCSQIQALDGGALGVGFHQVLAAVLSTSPNNGPPPGQYAVQPITSSGYGAVVQLTTYFSDGGHVGPFVATSGSVTFTQASPTRVAGHFDAIIPDAYGQSTELQGSFDAPYCP